MTKHVFIVGAQRCATTYLCEVLDQHPQILVARKNNKFVPEPKFFSMPNGVDKYNSYFKGHKEKVWVEKSVCYLHQPHYCSILHNFFPDATIIIALRNPVERSISQYYLTKHHGLETRNIEDAMFGDSIDFPELSMSPHQYLEHGEYLNYINQFLEKFQDVIIITTEMFVGCQKEVRKLYHKLKVDDFFPNVDIRPHAFERQYVPPTLIRSLEDYFAPHVDSLEKQLGIKLWDV